VVLVALLLVLSSTGVALPVSAESPTPAETPSSTIAGRGDPRSEGEGAGLVGDPVLVALGVVALGAIASGATLVYLRLTRDE
jgi:hypothetical protein